jgi:FMN phosphatase YigB (HAD superfamily)
MNWEVKAKQAGIELRCFSTPDELMAQLDSIPKETTIYIDSSLGNDIKGEEIAEQLHNLGYTNLYLATGYEPERFAHLTFLKGVIGKISPF